MSLTAFEKLAIGSAWGLGVRCAIQPNLGDQSFSLRQGQLHPAPANPQIATAAIPMGVNAAALVGGHHRGALRRQVQRGYGQYETQARQRLRRTNQGRLQLEA